MDPFLTAISGLAWTIVYIDAIRIGFRQKTYAMPMAALGLNFAWESVYAVRSLTEAVSLQGLVNLVWALADIAIVYTFFAFGRAEFPRFVTRTMFTVWGVLLFGASYAVQWLFLAEFGDNAARYSAFLQNLLMSGLFIAMFVARRGLRGQTLTIAIAKWLGTLAPTILIGVLDNSPFILGIGILCSVLDLVYIGLAVWAKAHPDALAAADTPTLAPPAETAARSA
ncbi:transmembrane-type terpene cyclase [Streptomyces sp. NPDC000880]